MRGKSGWLFMLVAVFGGAPSAAAHAQQLKPYFLVIVDTSGSMGWCSGAVTGNDDCSCHVGNCSTAFKTNRCGFPSNKLGDAKCSLQRIIDSTGGDAVFGLMQFEHPCDDSCNNTGSQCTGSVGACGSNCDDAQLAVEIVNNNENVMREWVDGTCGSQGSCGTHDFKHELTTGEWTPLAKSLQRANDYLRGNAASSGLPYVTGGSVPGSPLANDPQLACRPVSVILLTDGKDTCTASPTNDPPAAAAALFTGDDKLSSNSMADKAFRTYVIGFGSSSGYDPTTLNNIASMGGTTQYYPATNEADLSVALSTIIGDAQPPIEVCNYKDDDCDNIVDEGLPRFCDKPNGHTKVDLCTAPPETLCDGMDDNCDGRIDEGLTNACGTCGPVPDEVCDGMDNDCDGRIDEDISGKACGSSKGECKPGTDVCQAGMEQCQGQIGPTSELCDCKDNDCDGSTDEAEPGAMLCPDGQTCAGCKCVQFCTQTTEFQALCPSGLTPEFQSSGECLCVVDNCDHPACPQMTIMRNDQVVCAPSDPQVAACLCNAGTCGTVCDGVTCPSDQTCNPKNGRCVQDNCLGLGCPSGQLCDPAQLQCVTDACAAANCPADQACRAGSCEPSCAAISCGAGKKCAQGQCVADSCAAVSCDDGQACDPSSGGCVSDVCSNMDCPAGQVCSLMTGSCVPDGCWNLTCPTGQMCKSGECVMMLTPIGAGGAGGTGAHGGAAGGNRLVATGGGGCACSVPGRTTGSRPQSGAVWLLCLCASAAFARRRRAKSN